MCSCFVAAGPVKRFRRDKLHTPQPHQLGWHSCPTRLPSLYPWHMQCHSESTVSKCFALSTKYKLSPSGRRSSHLQTLSPDVLWAMHPLPGLTCSKHLLKQRLDRQPRPSQLLPRTLTGVFHERYCKFSDCVPPDHRVGEWLRMHLHSKKKDQASTSRPSSPILDQEAPQTIEGSLEVELPTIWKHEKQRREEESEESRATRKKKCAHAKC